jgi:hypothetical protein
LWYPWRAAWQLFTALALVLPLWAQEPSAMRVPLRFDTLTNLVTDGGLVRLRREYRQEPGQPIAIEGEEATVLEHHGMEYKIMADPEAANGHYIHYVKKLAFDFEVTTPGLYRARLRAWFPLKAGYNHTAQMDDGEGRMVVDSNQDEPKVWFWTTGVEYELTAGPHRYLFPSPNAFCAGARLDRLVLFPKGTPEKVEGFGPPTSPMVSPQEGEAITRRIKLTKIQEWRLEHDPVLNGGDAHVEYAFARDGAWQPVPAAKPGVLPALFHPLPTPKPRYIYFRFRLRGQPGNLSPRIEGLQLLIHKE